MSVTDIMIESLRKSIARKEKWFREYEMPLSVDGEIKEALIRIDALLKESLELDIKDLAKFEGFKNEEMKEKYKTKKKK
jgi:hypothetical protein